MLDAKDLFKEVDESQGDDFIKDNTAIETAAKKEEKKEAPKAAPKKDDKDKKK
jgi:hypothetical protein